jgi:hypothetical protein
MNALTMNLRPLKDRYGAPARYSLWLDAIERCVEARPHSINDHRSQDHRHWLCTVPSNAVADAVRDKLREIEPHLLTIVDAHGVASEAEHARACEQKVRRELADYRWPTWMRAKHRLQPVETVVQEIIDSFSLEAFIDNTIEAARNDDCWLVHDDVRDAACGLLERERNSLLATLSRHAVTPEEELTVTKRSSFDLQRRLHRVRVLLEETSTQTEPQWPWLENGECSAFCTSLTTKLRSIPHEDVVRARMLLRGMAPERGMDQHTLLAALMAACKDRSIWDALAQIRTVERAAEYAGRGGKIDR